MQHIRSIHLNKKVAGRAGIHSGGRSRLISVSSRTLWYLYKVPVQPELHVRPCLEEKEGGSEIVHCTVRHNMMRFVTLNYRTERSSILPESDGEVLGISPRLKTVDEACLG